MSTGAPKPGTGLFGYRRSAVEELMAESDARLREAEGRLRAAESRVADLETEIEALRRRNAQMDQRIQRFDGDGAAGDSEMLGSEPLESGLGWGEPAYRTAAKEER